MSWWAWVAVALAWLAVASGFALWLGAAAVVVQRREREESAHRWDDDALDLEWRGAG